MGKICLTPIVHCRAGGVGSRAIVRRTTVELNQELGSDREDVDIERFWRQRPDRMTVNLKGCIIYIVEFKKTMDLRPNFQVTAETRATRQYEWLAQT